MPGGQLILKQQQRTTADLADDEVELAGVAKIGGHHAAAVAIAVRPCQKAEVQEALAPDVEPDAIALEGAEVMPLADDVPRVLAPELFQGRVQLPGQWNLRRPVGRL